MASTNTPLENRASIADADRIAPAILAIAFGAFLVLGVGFMHSSTIHNAAHDARHAIGFPCH